MTMMSTKNSRRFVRMTRVTRMKEFVHTSVYIHPTIGVDCIKHRVYIYFFSLQTHARAMTLELT